MTHVLIYLFTLSIVILFYFYRPLDIIIDLLKMIIKYTRQFSFRVHLCVTSSSASCFFIYFYNFLRKRESVI